MQFICFFQIDRQIESNFLCYLCEMTFALFTICWCWMLFLVTILLYTIPEAPLSPLNNIEAQVLRNERDLETVSDSADFGLKHCANVADGHKNR